MSALLEAQPHNHTDELREGPVLLPITCYAPSGRCASGWRCPSTSDDLPTLPVSASAHCTKAFALPRHDTDRQANNAAARRCAPADAKCGAGSDCCTSRSGSRISTVRTVRQNLSRRIRRTAVGNAACRAAADALIGGHARCRASQSLQLCPDRRLDESLMKQAGGAEQTVVTCAIYRRHSGGFFAELCFNQNESISNLQAGASHHERISMLTLYHNDMSVCAAKVRTALAEKKLDWNGVHLDLRAGDAQRPEYLKLNPNAVVPTLCMTAEHSSSPR